MDRRSGYSSVTPPASEPGLLSLLPLKETGDRLIEMSTCSHFRGNDLFAEDRDYR